MIELDIECLEKGFMWQIEVERAKRYGRVDPLAAKAGARFLFKVTLVR